MRTHTYWTVKILIGLAWLATIFMSAVYASLGELLPALIYLIGGVVAGLAWFVVQMDE